MFSHYMYGHAPKSRGKITANTTEKRLLFGEKGVEEWVTLSFGNAKTISLRVRFLYPNVSDKRFPLIIRSADNLKEPIPLEEKAVTEYGFALAAFERCDLCGDRSILEMILQYRKGTLAVSDPGVIESVKKASANAPAQIDLDHLHPLAEAYPGYDWGEIAQWGYGYLICMDYFETLPQIDTEKYVIPGIPAWAKLPFGQEFMTNVLPLFRQTVRDAEASVLCALSVPGQVFVRIRQNAKQSAELRISRRNGGAQNLKTLEIMIIIRNVRVVSPLMPIPCGQQLPRVPVSPPKGLTITGPTPVALNMLLKMRSRFSICCRFRRKTVFITGKALTPTTRKIGRHC